MSNQNYVNLLHSCCVMVSFTYTICSVIIEHENFCWLPYIISWKMALSDWFIFCAHRSDVASSFLVSLVLCRHFLASIVNCRWWNWATLVKAYNFILLQSFDFYLNLVIINMTEDKKVSKHHAFIVFIILLISYVFFQDANANRLSRHVSTLLSEATPVKCCCLVINLLSLIFV